MPSHRRALLAKRMDGRRRFSNRDHTAWFMSKIEPEPNTGCWLWAGDWSEGKLRGRNSRGYGMVRGYPELLAHRLSYRLFIGPIPVGAFILHKCDLRLCVNPHHLYPGDHAQNMLDMKSRGRADDRRGVRNPQSKLSEDQVREIRALVDRGVRTSIIAAQYGLERHTVRYIATRRLWAHV